MNNSVLFYADSRASIFCVATLTIQPTEREALQAFAEIEGHTGPLEDFLDTVKTTRDEDKVSWEKNALAEVYGLGFSRQEHAQIFLDAAPDNDVEPIEYNGHLRGFIDLVILKRASNE